MTSDTTQNAYMTQCEYVSESAKIHQELVESKKSKSDLVETVLSNLEGIGPEEKIQIIQELKTELAAEDEAYEEKETLLKSKIKHAIEHLQDEIVHLIGAEANEQKEKVRQLSHDLLNVHQGHHHAVGILFRRYGIATDDIDMQKEVLQFVNSIEKAENTYQCITLLNELSVNMTSREERINDILHHAQESMGPKKVEAKPSWRTKWSHLRTRITEKLINWLKNTLPNQENKSDE